MTLGGDGTGTGAISRLLTIFGLGTGTVAVVAVPVALGREGEGGRAEEDGNPFRVWIGEVGAETLVGAGEGGNEDSELETCAAATGLEAGVDGTDPMVVPRVGGECRGDGSVGGGGGGEARARGGGGGGGEATARGGVVSGLS